MKKVCIMVVAALLAVGTGAALTGCAAVKDCVGGSCATP